MQDHFFIKNDYGYERVDFDAILYIVARDNYVRIITKEKFYVVLILLKEVEQSLPGTQFCRVNRSYLVSLDKVIAFSETRITLQNAEVINLGAEYRDHFLCSIPILVSESRSPVLFQRQKERAGQLAHEKAILNAASTWKMVPVRHVQ